MSVIFSLHRAAPPRVNNAVFCTKCGRQGPPSEYAPIRCDWHQDGIDILIEHRCGTKWTVLYEYGHQYAEPDIHRAH